MAPADLVILMNKYLSTVTDIIEAHGGFTVQYIGDSVLGVFGAPLNDPDHARNAVRAAVLIGNIGSQRRFNYTIMGDAVNLASRCEGANKHFGTSGLASESTVALTGKTFVWREIDAIRVVGRLQQVKIFEPLAEVGEESLKQTTCAMHYAKGLACWRNRDFATAAKHFELAADTDPPSALFLERAKKLALHPPADDWKPINTLESK